MTLLAPKTFAFSPLITAISVLLAVVMFRASVWQWDRYQFKTELVESYRQNSRSLPQSFPVSNSASSSESLVTSYDSLLHSKVELTGEYDYSREMIVINRRHSSGPGYWLLTPFKPDSSESYVIVSRGFIPFADALPADWEKYNFTAKETIQAVVQPTVAHRNFLSPQSTEAPTSDKESSFITNWRYPDLAKIALQMPYPIVGEVFLQRLGGPPAGEFPAESVSIEVPPSTHFGYSIEWSLLAIASLIVGYLLQAFPRNYRSRFGRGFSNKAHVVAKGQVFPSKSEPQTVSNKAANGSESIN